MKRKMQNSIQSEHAAIPDKSSRQRRSIACERVWCVCVYVWVRARFVIYEFSTASLSHLILIQMLHVLLS